MVYRGHVENGVILADDPVELPEGSAVMFEIARAPEPAVDSALPFAERFSEVMEKAQSFPEDAAGNHDRYLYGYGLPKE